jgi:hypothetical protein
MTDVDADKADEISEAPDSTGQDDKSQPVPLSDIGNQVDDADAMAVDKPDQVGSFCICFSALVIVSFAQADDSFEPKTNGLASAPLHDPAPEDISDQVWIISVNYSSQRPNDISGTVGSH